MKRLAPLLAVTIAAAAAVVATACGDEPTPQPCTDIPAGGCPIAHGVSCEDLACDAVYACLPGNRWELRERCPPHAPRPDASVDDAKAPDAEPAPFDASVDAPPGAYGGPGCAALEEPDCALGTALACPSGCCGCEDLFVCDQGGWNLWGTCTASGLVPAP